MITVVDMLPGSKIVPASYRNQGFISYLPSHSFHTVWRCSLSWGIHKTSVYLGCIRWFSYISYELVPAKVCCVCLFACLFRGWRWSILPDIEELIVWYQRQYQGLFIVLFSCRCQLFLLYPGSFLPSITALFVGPYSCRLDRRNYSIELFYRFEQTSDAGQTCSDPPLYLPMMAPVTCTFAFPC